MRRTEKIPVVTGLKISDAECFLEGVFIESTWLHGGQSQDAPTYRTPAVTGGDGPDTGGPTFTGGSPTETTTGAPGLGIVAGLVGLAVALLVLRRRRP